MKERPTDFTIQPLFSFWVTGFCNPPHTPKDEEDSPKSRHPVISVQYRLRSWVRKEKSNHSEGE